MLIFFSSVINEHTHTQQETSPRQKKEEKNITYDVENAYGAGIASEVNPNTYPF